MESISLKGIFGDEVFQDETVIVIQKSSLLKLTPTTNNTGESLLAAILITALQNFEGSLTDSDNQPITDEFNQSITYDNSEAFELLKIVKWYPFAFFRGNRRYINHQIVVSSYATN
jgi:hypothetical protein